MEHGGDFHVSRLHLNYSNYTIRQSSKWEVVVLSSVKYRISKYIRKKWWKRRLMNYFASFV